MASVSDVAKRAGVAYSTASIALRGVGKVSKKTYEKVHLAAQELGYSPNLAASVLVSQRHSVGSKGTALSLAWIDSTASHDSAQFAGFREAAESRGYLVERFVLSEEKELEALGRKLWNHSIQGIGLKPRREWDDWNWKPLGLERFSLIRFGRVLPSVPVAMVRASADELLQRGLNEIFARGYRRVGCLLAKSASDPDDDNRLATLLLYREKYLKRGQELHWLIFEKPNLSEENSCALLSFIKEKRIEGVIAFPWNVFYRKLSAANMSIPKDIGFAACPVGGRSTTARFMDKELSGVSAQPREQGMQGLEELHRMIVGKQRGIPSNYSQLVVTPSWVEGDTLPRIALKR